MDVLAELSYVSMTPDHFPSMFCKVGNYLEQLKYCGCSSGSVVTVTTFTVCVCLCVCLQEMSVGYANGIRVMSMTHTGEPGFMLYIPIEVNSASD